MKTGLDFDVKHLKGLSAKQVLNLQKKYGYNELPQKGKNTTLKIAWHIFTEPMIMLLLACGTIYFFLGDIKEASILIGCIAIIIGITFYQENKTEKALEALKNLSSPRALVIRDSSKQRIAGREVAVGDFLIISEGDRVPADAILLNAVNLEIDESILTGESVPVVKIAAGENEEMPKPGGDNTNGIFSSTLVVKGYGLAKVKAIGVNTEIGKIGKILHSVEQPPTRLQNEIKKIVATIATIGIFLCLTVALVYTVTRHDWVNGFLSGLALAMGILPEEFPLILTIFLAIGAWRIAKNNVLTRTLPAIENLGSATVLCVDKTGTITHNKMSVKSIYAHNVRLLSQEINELPADFYETLEFALLSSGRDEGDPMEFAIKDFVKKYLPANRQKHADWQLVNEYALSREILAVSNVWTSSLIDQNLVAAKGAPETIIDLCHLNKTESEIILQQVDAMASQGMRVLGVAKAIFDQADLPKKQHDFNFEFIGLIGLADTIRPMIKTAVHDCYSAGIRVIMITGDYSGTAKHIAKEIGLANPDDVITGQKLDTMNDQELRDRIKIVNIFARVVPEQKLRIINALKANNEVAAMTGDGVNDAPALKSADIGVAMGEKGTDVARESADIVLLDDDFSSIVRAIRMGRTIFYNLKKAMAYIVAVHIPIAGISLIPVLFKWPLVLLPIHIVFMELVVDPACSLVFENAPAEKTVMSHPPRKLNTPLFSRRTIMFSVRQGVVAFISVFGVFVSSLFFNYTPEAIRALTFATLVMVNMGLIFVNYSWSKITIKSFANYNKTFWSIQAFTLGFLLCSLYVPYLRNLFKFSFLHPVDLLAPFAITIVVILILDWLKMMRLKTKGT